MNKVICKICCKNNFSSKGSLSKHVTNCHDISSKQYYDLYIKRENEGICKNCKEETTYCDWSSGYRDCCSKECSSKLKWKEKDYRDKLIEKKKELYKDTTSSVHKFMKKGHDYAKSQESRDKLNEIKSSESYRIKLRVARKKVHEERSLEKKKEIYEKISNSHLENWKNEDFIKNYFSSGRKGYGEFGVHFSEKSGNQIYRSNSELACFKVLDMLNEVLRYESNKFRIPYEFNKKEHSYIADVLIYYKSGRKEVLEIKPDISYISNLSEKDKIKYSSAKEYCNKNDIEFNFWFKNYA
jgi:hypothetical protein